MQKNVQEFLQFKISEKKIYKKKVNFNHLSPESTPSELEPLRLRSGLRIYLSRVEQITDNT